MGTEKNLFRILSLPGHGAQVLPLELVPMSGHGAQISARAPTKGYVQTGANAPVPGTDMNGAYNLHCGQTSRAGFRFISRDFIHKELET